MSQVASGKLIQHTASAPACRTWPAAGFVPCWDNHDFKWVLLLDLGKREQARSGGTELFLSHCFFCMSYILPASGIIPPAGSIICLFVSIYRLKRRVQVLLLLGLQTAWVELSTWMFIAFGDVGREHASFLACCPPRFIVRALGLIPFSLCSWELFKCEEMVACLLFI